MGLPQGVDPEDFYDTGWAIVFHEDEDPSIRAALKPLIDHRRQQIGENEIVKELEYRTNESARDWLIRHRADFATVNPTQMPYYLLMVGGPERISFDFANLLNTAYGIGRLHFDDISGYEKYVSSIINYERSTEALTSKKIVFLGPRAESDRATEYSSEFLLKRLSGQTDNDRLFSRLRKVTRVEYESELIPSTEATKDRLQSILRQEKPALLFAATRGVECTKDDPRQKREQGALICQEQFGEDVDLLKQEHYFSADDLPYDAQVYGMICVFLANHSIGVPAEEKLPDNSKVENASYSFFAALPQSLLGHPQGGALGVIGQTKRGWLNWPNSTIVSEIDHKLFAQPYEAIIWSILRGWPLGHALQGVIARMGELSRQMVGMAEEGRLSDQQLLRFVLERSSLEGYMLFGDPAARLNIQALRIAQ